MMTFAESVKSTMTKNYVKFSGRASRSEFWWFQLFCYIASNILGIILLGAVFIIALNSDQSWLNDSTSDPTTELGNIPAGIFVAIAIFFLISLVFLLPTISSMVRRLHDRNMSGWLLLLFFILNIIPFINIIVDIVLLVFLCQEGTRGPNKYGPDPLRPSATADIFA